MWTLTHRDSHRSNLLTTETSDELDTLKLPLDPYELAYLRGGKSEVLILHLFDLMQKGCLIVRVEKREFGPKPSLVVAQDSLYLPPREDMTKIGQELLQCFHAPQTRRNTFRQAAFPDALKENCLRYKTCLRDDGKLSWFFGIGPSAKGKQFLKRLENQFDHLRDILKTARLGVPKPEHLLAVAVFGTSVLAGSSYDAFTAFLGDSTNEDGSEKNSGCDACG